jgi:hypothetical protein
MEKRAVIILANERVQMDRESQPEKSFPATQAAPGSVAALPVSTTTSDDDDCKSRSTEPSDNRGNSLAIASPIEGVASLLVTDDDDSRVASGQPGDSVNRVEMH